jgi:hypothetical protein
MKKKLPRLRSDEAAETFVACSDLTKYDLSSMKKVQLDFALKRLVVPVYDAMKADPKRAIPAKKVFATVRAQHKARTKASRP